MKNPNLPLLASTLLLTLSLGCVMVSSSSYTRRPKPKATPEPPQLPTVHSPSPHLESIRKTPVGSWAEWETRVDNQIVRRYMALTEGDEASVQLEISDGPWIVSTRIRLEDGKVMEALASRPGHPAQKVSIQLVSPPTPSSPPFPKEVISVPAGTFTCSKISYSDGRTTWITQQGQSHPVVKEISRNRPASSTRTLTQLDTVRISVPGGTFDCLYTQHRTSREDNSRISESWWSPEVPFSGLVKRTLDQGPEVLVGSGRKARPRLQHP